MVDRRLVLMCRGDPLCWGLMAGDIRRKIVALDALYAAEMRVWSVPSYEVPMLAEDITKRFAEMWAKELPGADQRLEFVSLNLPKEAAVGKAAAQ